MDCTIIVKEIMDNARRAFNGLYNHCQLSIVHCQLSIISQAITKRPIIEYRSIPSGWLLCFRYPV